MSINYKNEIFSLTGTGNTTVINIATTAIAIVKSVYCANTSTGSVLVKARTKSGGSNARFFVKNLATNTSENLIPQGLNLEAGDAIEVQSSEGGGVIEGVVSYALIDRQNENG